MHFHVLHFHNPAISYPAIWSVIFMCDIFMSDIFSLLLFFGPSISGPAFSVNPNVCLGDEQDQSISRENLTCAQKTDGSQLKARLHVR